MPGFRNSGERKNEMAQILKKTPLYELHRELGAKLIEFAGYEMLVQYAMGILGEHQHTRTKAGLFDVSQYGPSRFAWQVISGNSICRRHLKQQKCDLLCC